ncbi:MAG: tetratricopeptide repeat protein [Cyclobacteriaceae bacterium]
MNTRLLLFAIVIAGTSYLTEVLAQKNIVDSLQRVLQLHSQKDSVRVDLLNEITYNIRRINLDKSYIAANEAYLLAKDLGYKEGEAEALSGIGNYHYLSSNYTESLRAFNKSVDLAVAFDFKPTLSFSLNGIGMVYIQIGNFPLALDYIQRSLNIAEEINDQRRIAFSYYNIGHCYSNLGNYSLAINYYDRAREISEEIEKKDFVSVAFRDAGQMYTKLGNYDSALVYFENAMKIMREIDDKKGISFCMITLGILHKQQKDTDQAFEYFNEANSMSREGGFKHNVCNATGCLGDIYMDRGDYQTALKYVLESLTIAKELNILPEQRDAYGQLAKIYEKTNKFQKAYKSHIAFKELNDSIFNEESVRMVAILENSNAYEKEKQKADLIQQQKDVVRQAEVSWQKTIRNFFIAAFTVTGVLVIIVFRISRQRKSANNILTSQKLEIQEKNLELSNQRNALEKTLRELQKAQTQLVRSEKMASVGVLTAGIAHEINNPLNFIHGGKSALDKYTKKNLKDHKDKLQPFLDTIEMGIKRASGIVLSLNRFSREGSKKGEKCDMNLIIDNCLLMLKSQINSKVRIDKKYSKKTYELNGQEGELHQVMLNILANAVQAIEEEGTISIVTEVAPENLKIIISDTGVGIRKSNLNKVTNPFFTTKDPGKGTGLGMSIAQNIIEDHKGNIDYESEEGTGTIVTITLPLG